MIYPAPPKNFCKIKNEQKGVFERHKAISTNSQRGICCEVNKIVNKKVRKIFIKDTVSQILEYLKIKNANISVAIIGNADIKKINKKYRAKNTATDVLSFCYCKNPLDGEIVICYNEALKQAKERNHKLEQEIARLLTHSLLHLIGYDHKSVSEELKMKKLEDIILSKI